MPLIDPSEGSPVSIIRPDAASDLVLVCEHASRRMPLSLGSLGLDEAALASHIAWDIGALAVAQAMSVTLDATLVAQNFSRLAYDCNRPPEAVDAVPQKSEIYSIPGNCGLSPSELQARADALYHPFQAALGEVIDKRLASGRDVVLVTIHSFTPVYFGKRRDVEIGILHDDDRRLADAMLDAAAAAGLEKVRRNDPYGPEDGVTHTLRRHGLTRKIPNVMLEIRNDLIADDSGQRIWADRIARLLEDARGRREQEGGRLHA